MTNWISRNKKSIIRAAFLIPIISVATISISHVVSWYDLANPISWAIYLSIAVEIAAMSAIAAASVKVKGFSVWFVFIIVTLIQFIGNIFFSYSEIDVTSKSFKDWSELTAPVFEAMGSDLSDLVAQRRWLALLEGGLLPLISLTCLHFFIKYGEIDNSESVGIVNAVEEKKEPIEETESSKIESQVEEVKTEEPQGSAESQIDLPLEPTLEELQDNLEITSPVQEVPQTQPVKKLPPGISHKMKKITGRK